MRYWRHIRSFCIRKKELRDDYIPDTVVRSFMTTKREDPSVLLLSCYRGVFDLYDTVTKMRGVNLDRIDRVIDPKGQTGSITFSLVTPCKRGTRPPAFVVKGYIKKQGERKETHVHELVYLGKWNYFSEAIKGS